MPIRIQVVLPFQSGLPRDVATNTFTFDNVTSTPEVCAAIAGGRLETFYNVAPPPSVSPIAAYLSGVINRSQCRMVAYDLDDPQPRVPIWELDWVLGAAGGDNAPNELAAVASFQGDRQPGVPQARRRGRVYLGPLKIGVVATNTGTNTPTPNTAFSQTIANACDRLATASNGDAMWVVRSSVSGGMAQITNGWVDNDFDTQRRRQPRASSRILWDTP